MLFWIFGATILIVPIIMIIAGYFLYKHPPKTVNGIYGYRTSRSRKSLEAWNFAQAHCGKNFINIGFLLLIISVIAYAFFYKSTEHAQEIASEIFMAIQCVGLCLAVIPTEKALKENFDENGKRK